MALDQLKKERIIQVYTGEGKGKTTAALGQAIRACGHGWKVLIIQFMKGKKHSGENIIYKKIPNLEIIQSGLSSFIQKENPSKRDVALAVKGLELAQQAITKSLYDMVILDEINVAVEYGLIPINRVIELLRNKPKNVEVVLTGRNAHKRIIQIADLVSVIHNFKHPFQQKLPAREGIEF